MTVLGDTHVDIKQNIVCLKNQREYIPRDMAQMVALEAKLDLAGHGEQADSLSEDLL